MRTAAALVFTVLMLGCGSSTPDGYQAYLVESQVRSDAAAAYVAAGDQIASLRSQGRVTDAQWQRFVEYQAKVRDAENAVFPDLVKWRSTGVKPPTYGLLAKALGDAQSAVRGLLLEVSQ